MGSLSEEVRTEVLCGYICDLEAKLSHCIELPKDADGEYIHVGDEMCGYGWPNGGVYCRAIVNEVTILVGPQDGAYRGWLMWAANECRHYHAPDRRGRAGRAAGRERQVACNA